MSAQTTEFIYAVSRIRAIERKLLSHNKLIKMLETNNEQEAIKILDEAGYQVGYYSTAQV